MEACHATLPHSLRIFVISMSALLLGEVAPISTFAEGDFHLADDLPIADAIIEIIRRHPMRETKLAATLDRFGLTADQVQSTLATLEANGRARRHLYRGQVFWEYSGSRFGLITKSRTDQATGFR